MQKHIRTYLRHFDLGEQSLITCEACGKMGRVDGEGFDIHHIHGRVIKDADDIKNLICLCRKHHTMAHENRLIDWQLIHNYFLSGTRKIFVA